MITPCFSGWVISDATYLRKCYRCRKPIGRRSNSYRLWWRPDRRGYTTNIAEAGLYDEEESQSIERLRGTDVRVPSSVVERNTVRVVHTLHTHRARNVIVSQEAIDLIYSIASERRTWVLENAESGAPWSSTHIRRVWDVACDAAGITGPDRVLHAIRHTFCSTLFEYGATIPEAAQAMGITLKQVETYAHPLRPMATVFEKAHRFGPKKVEAVEENFLQSKKLVG